MKVRSLLVATATLAALAGGTLTGSPAHADGPDALAFTCTAHIPGFGVSDLPQNDGTCGGTSAAAGIGDGASVAGTGNFSAVYSYTEPTLTCPALGTANGTATVGGVSENFSWLRIGAVAVITLNDGSGSATDLGAAVATFAVTSPVGNPCGHDVTAQAAGVALGVE